MWEYDTDDGGKHQLFMDAGEIIRFRVTGEIFQECGPSGPTDSNFQENNDNSELKIPYMITVRFLNVSFWCLKTFKFQASINEPGLGLLTWWDTNS